MRRQVSRDPCIRKGSVIESSRSYGRTEKRCPGASHFRRSHLGSGRRCFHLLTQQKRDTFRYLFFELRGEDLNLPRCSASLLRVIASRLVAVPGAASALRPRTCRPRPIWLLPSSATGGGRRQIPTSYARRSHLGSGRRCFHLLTQQKRDTFRYLFFELRGEDLNLRPPGYEPDELPDCSTPR